MVRRRMRFLLLRAAQRTSPIERGQDAAAGRARRAGQGSARKDLPLLARHARQRRRPDRGGGRLAHDPEKPENRFFRKDHAPAGMPERNRFKWKRQRRAGF